MILPLLLVLNLVAVSQGNRNGVESLKTRVLGSHQQKAEESLVETEQLFAGFDTGYFSINHEPLATYPRWQARIFEDTWSLSDIVLPGTHDSGAIQRGNWNAILSMVDLYAKAQAWDIKTQLNAGIRFFDLRPCNTNDNLPIWHGVVPQLITLADALKDIAEWLKESDHNLEFVAIRLRQECNNGDNARFFPRVHKLLDRYPDQFFSVKSIGGSQSIPRLYQIRGKMVILAGEMPTGVGTETAYDENFLRWSGDFLNIQDEYEKCDKISYIKEHQVAADKETSRWSINFVSAAGTDKTKGGICSPRGAAYVNNGKVFDWIKAEYYAEPKAYHNYGVLIFDFPQADLIRYVIAQNWQKTNGTWWLGLDVVLGSKIDV